jgi:hypothetical protein
MNLHYYAETDSLYIELSCRPGVDTREIADGLVADLDAEEASWASTSTAPRTNSISQRWKPSHCP